MNDSRQLNMAGTSLSAFRCDAIALFHRSSFSAVLQIAYTYKPKKANFDKCPSTPQHPPQKLYF
jgi:hypothetical protein